MADDKAVLRNDSGKSTAEFLAAYFGCAASEPQDEPAEVVELEVSDDAK
jgi:hypothetical protein